MTARILVTGSRTWDDRATLEDALLDAWNDAMEAGFPAPGIVVVHGACPRGADALADAWAREMGLPVEPHPADWQQHGKRAGFLRNQHMVDLGADVALAFIRDGSAGATHTAAAAERAGIPTRRFTA